MTGQHLHVDRGTHDPDGCLTSFTAATTHPLNVRFFLVSMPLLRPRIPGPVYLGLQGPTSTSTRLATGHPSGMIYLLLCLVIRREWCQIGLYQ